MDTGNGATTRGRTSEEQMKPPSCSGTQDGGGMAVVVTVRPLKLHSLGWNSESVPC